jgi:hypothetical protein
MARKAIEGPITKEPVVIASKVKLYVRSQGMMMSNDAVAAISGKVYDMLDAAIKRSQANKRSTLRPQDL